MEAEMMKTVEHCRKKKKAEQKVFLARAHKLLWDHGEYTWSSELKTAPYQGNLSFLKEI